MSLSLFHPIVARWFGETLGAPTAAQRQGWPAIREGRHTLIAAPTGSGKTLAAFLTSLDDLFVEGLQGPLPDEVRVVYVSPLKALSADIHKNLAEPRRGIRRLAEEAGMEAPRITAAVRTGDTTQAERTAMLRTPPHILVTTPESLYLLLTAERTRDMLRTTRTVIVDEIHAVIGTRRGAHLALSLERLQEVAERPLVRLGLSATQKPIEEVARFLVGTAQVDANGRAACAIVDEGHRRAMDLNIEIPQSTLDAVMSHEVWTEYYARLTSLIDTHRTTLVFVNTRNMAERLARHLSERLGADAVTAHHGSLSKEKRLDAESRLKAGQLKALVATASLELGIDIGSVDLVCQIGSPRRIATLLQRIGRSGHSVSGTPKGRLFPTSRDDLIESLALLRASRRGDLDLIVSHDAPLDVLAQQIVAETSCREYGEDELFALMRGAWVYRDLARRDFDAVVTMVAEGFSTKRGRRGALLHRDEVQGRLRGRRGARMLAITSGGAIPEIADYRVLLEPEDTFIGTLNEDFAIESNAGDIFQLGNASWRILRVGAGVVRVADAKGAPPTIPFWLGEAPGRSDELSRAVSDLRAYVDRALPAVASPFASNEAEARATPQAPVGQSRANGGNGANGANGANGSSASALLGESSGAAGLEAVASAASERDDVARWLVEETGAPEEAITQALDYLSEGRAALGVLPTQDTLVLERFFDESGGMQLVLHAPFGSRINKAWGLALRKRFCRQFNFELQAAATEDALLLSLGPQHSFPLADVFRYLHPSSARDVLVQAFLDAPVFQTRWRWNTTISLAVPRNRTGRKVPPQLQRMIADDLMAAVFPDAAACLENIPGDREIPDHPLVNQTVRDCLQEAMDFDGLTAVLARIHRGDVRCVSRDTPEPSTLSHEILNARPYAFLDDAPLEERRAHAVYARRAGEPSRRGDDLSALDAAAIDRVRDEARPDPRDADELHDVLLTVGVLTAAEAAELPRDLFDRLTATRRVGHAALPVPVLPALPARSAGATDATSTPAGDGARGTMTAMTDGRAAAGAWIAAERLPELLAVHPDASVTPALTAPASRAARAWTRDAALIEFVRGRLTIVGPTTARELAASLSVDEADIQTALLALEAEGAVLRGRFTPGPRDLRGARGDDHLEWCDRRLLARIHRYTLNRLRAEIEPVSPAEFMRFLFAWQHVDPASRLTGLDGLRAIAARLDGFELAANAWERAVLPARLDRYEPSMLDLLCLSGEVGWARLSTGTGTGTGTLHASNEDAPPSAQITKLGGTTAIALFLREHAEAWQTLRLAGDGVVDVAPLRSATSATPSARPATGASPSAAPAAPAASSDPAGPAASASLPRSEAARRVLDALERRGASFFRELTAACAMDAPTLRRALGELAAAGLVASDGFAGLRAIVQASRSGPATGKARDGRDTRVDPAGRWSVLRGEDSPAACEAATERQAWALLRRYGVVFRRLLTREANARPWRELARVYRRLEARGEIRGGRFVAGVSGEQFALADAVDTLRDVRRTPPHGRLLVVSAADPLNLAGIVTAGDRVTARGTSRIVYRDGVPLAAMEGDYVRPLADIPPTIAGDVASALAGRRVPPIISGYLGRAG